MIMWPFDPKTTGLSATSKDTGAYIMWAGTPYAHLHIMGQPVGTPMEHVAVYMQDDGGAGSVESSEIQMARAIAAGPKEITDQARIMGTDAQGNRIVLREGNNDFICQPGKPQLVAPHHLHACGRDAAQHIRSRRQDQHSPRNRSTLDGHDAVRSQNHGVASHLQRYGGVYYVGGNPLCPPAHHGEAVDRVQSGGRAAWPCGYLGLSAVTALAVVLAQNSPLEAECPWVLRVKDGGAAPPAWTAPY